MKTILSLIAALSLFVSTTSANNNEEKAPKKTYTVTGKVMDVNESLTGVKVILDGKETSVYTDLDGNFTLNNVVEGEHMVSLSFVTYNNKEIIFNPEKSNDLVIELQAK